MAIDPIQSAKDLQVVVEDRGQLLGQIAILDGAIFDVTVTAKDGATQFVRAITGKEAKALVAQGITSDIKDDIDQCVSDAKDLSANISEWLQSVLK